VVKGKTITVKEAQKPARAPQGGAGVSAAMGLQVASIAAGGTAAVLGGVAISNANDAKDEAAAATAAATSAEQEAAAATAAANAAGDAANAAGCALNDASGTSAYTPPAGYTCP
jgi:hypothetical protein